MILKASCPERLASDGPAGAVESRGFRPAGWPEGTVGLSQVLTGVLVIKLAAFLAALMTGRPNPAIFDVYVPGWDRTGCPDWVLPLACMDAGHYLNLGQNGYRSGDPSAAFYPAWPWVLGGTGIAGARFGPLLAAGLATLLWGLGGWMLYRWTKGHAGRDVAQATLLAIALHPSAFFFWLGYSESLFFFLCCLFITQSESRRWWVAMAACFFLPMTRPVGALVGLVPLWWILMGHPGPKWRPWLMLGAVAAGWAGYLGWMYHQTGSAFEGFAAQRFFVNSPRLGHLLEPLEFMRRLVRVEELHNPTGSLLDRLMFLCGLALLGPLWRIRRDWVAWAGCMLIIPAFTNWFLSCSRFTASIVPLFFPLALLLVRLGVRWLMLVCCASLLLQFFLAARYFDFRWAN